MRKTWVVLLAVLAAGCNSGRQPEAVQKPPPENTPIARQSKPAIKPPLLETRATPPVDVPKRPMASDRVLNEPAPAAKTPEHELPKRHEASGKVLNEPAPAVKTPVQEVTKRQEPSDPGVMDAARAIKIAEQFVRDNGYTDFVPPDAGKLVSESIEREGREKWIADRHNTLRPRALGRVLRKLQTWRVSVSAFRRRTPNSL